MNPVFSGRDNIEYQEYVEYITPIHGATIAVIMAQMIMYKKKYHLTYSEEQEEKIRRLFCKGGTPTW